MNDEIKTRTVSLTLTHACNLKCVYCYEMEKSSSKMSFETAKEILDFEMNKKGDYDRIEIDLFGGEPFLQFDLIKQIVEYVLSREWKQKYVFFAVTNGTLVHREVQQWLREHGDCFVCGLSYDGSPAMQDCNRSNSSNLIDLAFFQEMYADQPIKMTISNETLGKIAQGVAYLYELGFEEVACNLAYGIDWTDSQNEKVLSEQLMELSEFFLDNPQYKPCSILDMGIETADETENLYRFCGAGINMVAYDVDGKHYPCQMFMPMTAGKERAEMSQNLTFYEEAIPDTLIDECCRKCVIKPSCPNCFGANYVASGNMYHHAEDYCKLTKTIAKARSYFKGMQWQKGQLDLSESEEHALLHNIITIQEKL